jgi:transposase InsO family protein
VRPATPLIHSFIDEYADRFGVAPICRALAVHGLQIAPRTYWAHRSSAPSKRELWDTTITEILARVYEPDEHGKRPPESLYGSLKMWAHLQRQGITVARCTVERIMRVNGWRGAMRARRVRTTVADPAATRAPDLVRRRFRVARPDQLHVADFTYVPMAGGGFGYTAFVIDAYAGLIPGWECSLTKNTAFVERAIRAAVLRRAQEGHPLTGDTIHHSDAGSQYTAIHFTETLMLAGLIPSIGTVGDALDNALAETTIGLYKTECVREGSPFRNGPLRTLADLEDCTSAWVHWYNASRLMHRLGRRPPAEAEAEYYAQQPVGQHTSYT